MAPRVVIGTNIFVSSFFGGNPEKIVGLWLSGEATLCVSSAIIEEYIAVLQRICPSLGNKIEGLLELFGKGFNLVFTTRTPTLNVVEADPDDDKFIECADALQAQYIVTGDKALLAIGKYGDIEIIGAKRFLEIMTTS